MESASDRVSRFLDASYMAGWEFSDEEFDIDSDVSSDFDLNTEPIDDTLYIGGVEDYEDFETGLHLLPLDFNLKSKSGAGSDLHLTLDIYDEKESELDNTIKLKKDEDVVLSTFLKPTNVSFESPILSSRVQNISTDDLEMSPEPDSDSLSSFLMDSKQGSGKVSNKKKKTTVTKDKKTLTVVDFKQFNTILKGYLNNLNNLNIRFQ